MHRGNCAYSGEKMSKLIRVLSLFSVLLALPSRSSSIELVIGTERIEPGIIAIFEGAIKDIIEPREMHLEETLTDVHIEARINWDTENIPAGTPSGGFVPYLHVTALITNQKTNLRTFIDLKPHMNLIDNFHYARNISLPGAVNDPYSVEFKIMPPDGSELALHKDWKDNYGTTLFSGVSFSYKDVNFEEIAKATRR